MKTILLLLISSISFADTAYHYGDHACPKKTPGYLQFYRVKCGIVTGVETSAYMIGDKVHDSYTLTFNLPDKYLQKQFEETDIEPEKK
jgi:hypothetical protein